MLPVIPIHVYQVHDEKDKLLWVGHWHAVPITGQFIKLHPDQKDWQVTDVVHDLSTLTCAVYVTERWNYESK